MCKSMCVYVLVCVFVPAYSQDKMYVYRFENTQREEDVIG